MQNAIFPSAVLAEFYRFALLLTGRTAAAEKVMAETIADVQAELQDLRNEANRQAWLALRIRQRCLQNNAEHTTTVPRLLRHEVEPGGRPQVLAIEAYILAEHFHLLPEPERSALALFYLDLFTPEEIAQLLKMAFEELADTLAAARTRLQGSLSLPAPFSS